MRNPLARLVHRDPAKPTLRQRAASLKASASQVMRRRQPDPERAASAVPDPIVAAIKTARSLHAVQQAAYAVCGSLPDTDPAWEPERKAYTAWWAHIDNVLLKTVPTTAAGCIALAQFAIDFCEKEDVPLSEGARRGNEREQDNIEPLRLIAQSPAARALSGTPTADRQAAPKVDAGDATDWANPPPGFMAVPAINPQCFVAIRLGLRGEIERLYDIAEAEFERRVEAYRVGVRADEVPQHEARLRRELLIEPLAAALALKNTDDVQATRAAGADADLIALGQEFNAAVARWRAADADWGQRHGAAEAQFPPRPETLLFRESDHPFCLRRVYEHPCRLEGAFVTAGDIAWMSRKPLRREVRRPVRPEDNLPASAHTVTTGEPWPEAQARADEIIAAWNAWRADRERIEAEHGVPEASAAADAAVTTLDHLAARIASSPALTAEGFKVKLRVVAHYADGEVDGIDPEQAVLASLFQDAERREIGEAATANPQGDMPREPVEHPGTSFPDGTIQYADIIGRVIREPVAGWIGYMAMRLHSVAAQEMTRAFNAQCNDLDQSACKELDSRLRRDLRLDALHALAFRPHKVFEAAEAERRALDMDTAPSGQPEPDTAAALLQSLDLPSLPVSTLQAIHRHAGTLSDVAVALSCQRSSWDDKEERYSAAGRFVDWLTEVCSAAIAACEDEVRGRQPADWWDRERRLSILAQVSITNGDTGHLEAFARDVAAQAIYESVRDAAVAEAQAKGSVARG